jgi:hypothetical protein
MRRYQMLGVIRAPADTIGMDQLPVRALFGNAGFRDDDNAVGATGLIC